MKKKELILLVEDDPAVLSAVKRRLTFEGYKVEIAQTGSEAIEKAFDIQPSLILMDIMLPEMDGLEATERIRQKSDVPILIITAKDTVPDVVAGFERGADDYVVKPFAIEVLLARIRGLLRRSYRNGNLLVLSFADLSLDSSTREIARGDITISLTPREFSILEYFMRHPRQVMTREQIFEAVWGSEHIGDSNIIDVNIRTLREKLEIDDFPRLIHTIRGVGYTLREV